MENVRLGKCHNSSTTVFSRKGSGGAPIAKTLSRAAERLVDSLKINSISEKTHRGRRLIIKRRNGYSEPLADLTNLYFRMARIPIRFWLNTEKWEQWEVKCFNMLNNDRFHARASGASSVCADKLPGKSVWDHLSEGTPTPQMMEAAGHELRGAHWLWSEEFHGPWSPGDADTNNVIYHQQTGRVRLIDFEIVHQKSLPATSRHADDLLVFLLDLMAIASNRQWLTLVFGVPQRLRQCAGDCAFEEPTRSANRHGMDLVGRSNKFRKPR
jgi:hypothetical protein